MTDYKLVFDKFKDKITDPDLLLYAQNIQDEILLSTMETACSRFNRLCKVNLNDRNNSILKFNADLGDEIIDIITDLMVEIWLYPFLNNAENLRNRLNTKDYEKISPANLLSAIQNTYNQSRKRAKSRMNEYSFINGKIEDLKT